MFKWCQRPERQNYRLTFTRRECCWNRFSVFNIVLMVMFRFHLRCKRWVYCTTMSAVLRAKVVMQVTPIKITCYKHGVNVFQISLTSFQSPMVARKDSCAAGNASCLSTCLGGLDLIPAQRWYTMIRLLKPPKSCRFSKVEDFLEPTLRTTNVIYN